MAAKPEPVVAWLLDADPAVRWQVLRDIVGAGASRVASEQVRVAREGWGARLLERQGAEGVWTGLYSPKWTSATYTLLLLRQFGLRTGDRAARKGATRLLDAGLYRDNGINFWRSMAHSETCVTGMMLGIAARFAPDDDRAERLVENLMAEQMLDGGWNCRRHWGATHSSLHTTLSALEGLLEYEHRGGRHIERSQEARERAHEFLYAHRMYRSHRTSEVINDRMTRFSFPPHWHYDVLRGLDYLQAANAPKDPRLEDAVELLITRRTRDGTWLLQNVHRGQYYFQMETSGEPSRWNTLRALRVLRWWRDETVS